MYKWNTVHNGVTPRPQTCYLPPVPANAHRRDARWMPSGIRISTFLRHSALRHSAFSSIPSFLIFNSELLISSSARPRHRCLPRRLGDVLPNRAASELLRDVARCSAMFREVASCRAFFLIYKNRPFLPPFEGSAGRFSFARGGSSSFSLFASVQSQLHVRFMCPNSHFASVKA